MNCYCPRKDVTCIYWSTFKREIMSNEEKIQLAKMKKVSSKARRIADVFKKDMEANNKLKGGSAFNYYNSWVVKPHQHTPLNISLSVE
jgi:hypothetical protein